MSKKKTRKDWGGNMVYSTNPDYHIEDDSEDITLNPSEQNLRIWLEKGGRGGKVASVIKGYIGTEEDLKVLGKKIKTSCGTGGSAKNGEIIIQGDHRDKMLELLTKAGYKAKKAGG